MNKKNHTGSLQLDWINKDFSLYYEIDEKEGKGVRPVWVEKNDIRVSEPRILRFIKDFGDKTSENMLIKGDNLLVLRSLTEMFSGRPDKEKIKCIYIDPPYNTGNAFDKYDDNLQHSEWLTMMRDRLFLLKKLLREDGAIVVQIDNQEFAYLKILLDEIFGRQNYVDCVTLETRTPSGYKVINPGFFNSSEYLFIYAKNKKQFSHKTLYKEKEFEEHYNKYVERKDNKITNWRILNLKDVVAKELGFKSWRDGKKKIGKDALMGELQNFAMENAANIAALEFVGRKASQKIINAKTQSLKQKGKIFVLSNDKKENTYLFNGREIVFYSKKIREIDGDLVGSIVMSNIWTDISWSGIGTEGGVEFKYSKKPEKLIKRIIEFCTDRGDIVFDSFAGSGTTGAVAHKMGRRWLMVEMGRQAEELIIPRMQRVVVGKDQTGISKDINWIGGGGFKYYQLGESVINGQDMNWSLKAVEIAEAIFLHFQYNLIEPKWMEKENIYLGKHQSFRYHFAISFVSREIKTLTEDLYEKIVFKLEKEKFKHLTIFTNVAIAVPPELLDKRILVRKIPATILREYSLI